VERTSRKLPKRPCGDIVAGHGAAEDVGVSPGVCRAHGGGVAVARCLPRRLEATAARAAAAREWNRGRDGSAGTGDDVRDAARRRVVVVEVPAW